jgi:hypothetical protein
MKPNATEVKNAHRPLVINKLEMVSKDIFRQYFDLITKLIGDSPGVYALYDDNELYYVGKSTDLRNRVKHHLRDRHGASWTHFSLYLARKEVHIHEIESLIVRISNPKGNRVIPKGKSSGPLLRSLKSMVQQKQKDELSKLFGRRGSVLIKQPIIQVRRSIVGLVKQSTPLYKTYKGKDYKATLRPDGTIVLNEKEFSTPTAAAQAITHTSVNGLRFWFIEDLNGDLVKLGIFMRKQHG